LTRNKFGDGSVHRYRSAIDIKNVSHRSLKEYIVEFVIPNRMARIMVGDGYPRRYEVVGNENYSVIFLKMSGDVGTLLPGQVRRTLILDYFIDGAASSLIESGVPVPQWRVLADDTPMMSGVIPWANFQEY
jgi:hypothetical protein